MTDRLRRLHGCALLLAIALTVGACAGNDGAEVPDAAPGAVAGGTFTVATQRPGSIDPTNAYDEAGRLIVQTLCDPLIQLDPVSGELKPAIADSWALTDRGRKLTLRIRKGARFSNGESVTADDVSFTLSRLASADFASFESDLVARVEGYADVHGDTDTDNAELRRSLSGVRVIEGNSLEITLAGEYSPFIRALAHPAASPVPRGPAEEDPIAFERQPICAGPYRVAAPWHPGEDRIVLERSEHYNARNAGYTAGGRGYADRIEFALYDDLNAQLDAFRAGEVDVAEVPGERAGELRASLGAQLVEAVTPAVEYVGVPADDEPFRDPRTRQALSLALDRRAIVAAVDGGAHVPATGFFPPTLGDALHREDACEAVRPTPDVERARSLLDEAGVSLKERTLTFTFNDEFDNRAIVDAVAAQWRAAFGVGVELVAMPWQEYLSKGTGSEGFDGPFRVSWAPTHADPDRYLAPLLSSEGIGVANFGRFSNPQFDRVLNFSARRALEEEDRVIEYRRLEDIACREMPLIPVTFDVDHYLIRDHLAAPDRRLMNVTSGAPSLREIHLRGTG